MAFSAGGRDKLKAEINVTPLVDVVLVLLIIFMVVTPLLTRGKDVQLPVASSGESPSESTDAVVLTITAERGLWLEHEQVSLDSVVPALERRDVQRSGQEVLIKADSSVTVRELRPILQKLKAARITQIGFAVAEPPRSAP